MRRHPLVLASAAAVLLGAAAAVPATAAPPARTPTTTYNAPYSGFAWFGPHVDCGGEATCTVTGSASAAGTYDVQSAFARETPAGGSELAYGIARQSISYKVPPAATRVTATFTWDVDTERSAVTASSTSGFIQAWTGFAASAPDCDTDPATRGCTSRRVSRLLQHASSADGVPSPLGVGGPAESVSLTVEVTDRLPRQLLFWAHPYAGAGGQESATCVEQTCQTMSAMHAGAASAEVYATLTSVTVTAE